MGGKGNKIGHKLMIVGYMVFIMLLSLRLCMFHIFHDKVFLRYLRE